MKEYIITIIGATLLSAMAGIIAPEKWRSYVQVITGLVIISCIISPVTAIVKSDIFDGFDSVQENIADSSNMQTELVIEELKNRILAKQDREMRNTELYKYMHNLLGAKVVEIFDKNNHVWKGNVEENISK